MRSAPRCGEPPCSCQPSHLTPPSPSLCLTLYHPTPQGAVGGSSTASVGGAGFDHSQIDKEGRDERGLAVLRRPPSLFCTYYFLLHLLYAYYSSRTTQYKPTALRTIATCYCYLPVAVALCRYPPPLFTTALPSHHSAPSLWYSPQPPLRFQRPFPLVARCGFGLPGG